MKNIRQTDLNPLYVYISPPSFEILEQRLRGRQTDSESAIEKRLKEAKESMEFSKEPGMYDHIILNDKLDVAYEQFKGILSKVRATFVARSDQSVVFSLSRLQDIAAILEQQKTKPDAK